MQKITIAKGDGIGPEIMEAVIAVLEVAVPSFAYDEIEVGERVYGSGVTSGIGPEAWAVIRRNKVLLKAPITTPSGGGYKSLNVTLRKSLGLFANVRPSFSLHPYVATRHPKMNVVIVRENEEDLYAGIEHRQTEEVVQCLKLISRPGCERIVNYAFEYALANGRKKVTCFIKDNIMKQTDGLFHQVFKEISHFYPTIQSESRIVDIGTALIASNPELFDVIVMPNLYGDVVSDVTAQLSGSVGLAGSANIGEHICMFEAIHGSAPDIAGKGMANPSGLLQGAIMMLNHLGQQQVANTIQQAWAVTLEKGIHTPDIYHPKRSKRKVSTMEFAAAIIDNLGRQPVHLQVPKFENNQPIRIKKYQPAPKAEKKLKGVDVFVDFREIQPNELAKKMQQLNGEAALTMITNRGVKVWPEGFEETFCTDHWRCRFEIPNGKALIHSAIPELLSKAIASGIEVIKTENLYEFDGVKSYSAGQGQ